MKSHTPTDSSISTTSSSQTVAKLPGQTAAKHPTPPPPPTDKSKKGGTESTSIEEIIPTAAELAESKQKLSEAIDHEKLQQALRQISVLLARVAPEKTSAIFQAGLLSDSSGTLNEVKRILRKRGYETETLKIGHNAALKIRWEKTVKIDCEKT